MDRARTDRGRVSRLVARILFVLGGAIVATAVGWLISSATASADTLPDLTVPGTHAAPVASTVTGVLTAVDVPTIPPPPAVTGALSGAVTQLGAPVTAAGRDIPVTPLAATPAKPTQVPPPAPGTAGQSGPAIGQAAARPMTTVTTVAPIPPGPATVVRSVPRAVGAVGVLAPPVVPMPAAPWSPGTVPAAPGGTVGGAPGGTGIGVADAAGRLPVPGVGVVRVAPTNVPQGNGTAGKQPGSTPD